PVEAPQALVGSGSHMSPLEDRACGMITASQRRASGRASVVRRPSASGLLRTGAGPPPQPLPHQGPICGVPVEEVEDPLMQQIRQLDKLVDELAKGKPMEKILRA